MSIPVHVSARRVGDDCIDLTVCEEAGGFLRVSMRLSRASALRLARGLIAAILEHPEPLPVVHPVPHRSSSIAADGGKPRAPPRYSARR